MHPEYSAQWQLALAESPGTILAALGRQNYKR
jgi:hypothetical protein